MFIQEGFESHVHRKSAFVERKLAFLALGLFRQEEHEARSLKNIRSVSYGTPLVDCFQVKTETLARPEVSESVLDAVCLLYVNAWFVPRKYCWQGNAWKSPARTAAGKKTTTPPNGWAARGVSSR